MYHNNFSFNSNYCNTNRAVYEKTSTSKGGQTTWKQISGNQYADDTLRITNRTDRIIGSARTAVWFHQTRDEAESKYNELKAEAKAKVDKKKAAEDAYETKVRNIADTLNLHVTDDIGGLKKVTVDGYLNLAIWFTSKVEPGFSGKDLTIFENLNVWRPDGDRQCWSNYGTEIVYDHTGIDAIKIMVAQIIVSVYRI